MHRENYGRIIQEWCNATGMTLWQEHEDKHVEIDGFVCGLIPGGHKEPDVMHVLIDLGNPYFPDLHQRLLEQNVPLESLDRGCFGLHPITGSVVYRTSFQLTSETNGGELPLKISVLIQSLMERLEISSV